MSPPVALTVPGLTNKDMKELSYVPKEVSIYFGSQSGTAECFSDELHEECTKYGITSEVLDLRAFTPESFAMKKIVILIVASYGDGEPTENAFDFAKWASCPKNDGVLAGQRFTVMGLGDMNYTRFNKMGMDTDFNLERLGGKRMYERGVGDDSQDIQADFKNWKEGLWQRLRKAVAEVEAEGGYREMANAAKKNACQPDKVPLFLFYGHEEKDGAAKDITDTLVDKLNERKFGAPTLQSLSDRKACEVVKKMPKGGVAIVVVDSSPEALCPAGKKLVRNMTVELDKQGLKDKGCKYCIVTVATCSSAAQQKTQIEQNSSALCKAFDRIAADPLDNKLPRFIDASEDASSILDGICGRLSCVSSEPVLPPANPEKSAKATSVWTGPASAKPQPTPTAVPRTVLLCTGNDAREAAQKLVKVLPRSSVEDAALVSMAGAARNQTQVVLVVDCNKDGLSDGANGLAAQLRAAPLAMAKQLGKLRLVVLKVVGDRNGKDKSEIARAVDPLSANLARVGAHCLASPCIDQKEMNDNTVSNLGETVKDAFGMNAPEAKPPPAPATPVLAAAAAPQAPPPLPGTTEVRMSVTVAGLPAEVPGEPADVLSRYYFEADECKVQKVRQLRQEPKAEEGLSTVEIEFEAKGKLAEYSLGGTFSCLPENDPEDVLKILPLLDLQPEDLKKPFTFAVGTGVKFKKPFPTPCTVEKALTMYCDLSKAPTKKMLTALLPHMNDAESKDRIEMLLKDEETLKTLQSSALCCRMHEFWALLGIDSIDLCDFLLHCPRQKAREFTIASSPSAMPNKIGLCVSLTCHEQPNLGPTLEMLCGKGLSSPNVEAPQRQQTFLGTCSTWMNKRLAAGAIVLAKQRASPLKLPKEDVPVIMLGAGAGVAPFKGFWEELRKGSQTAPAVLFFGCRHAEKDWLFKDEMNGAVKLGAACGALARMRVGPKRPLAALYTAFSRPDNAAEKRYVQDHLRDQAGMVRTALDNKGQIFICGSSAMGKAVLDTLGDTIEGGKEAVEALRKDGRIVAEMWG